ncbi:MAG: EAL domain-containing protein [Lachnospiraceae bacterium]|nr:EAL domain-containing protein [Lachnospiraceae bacterium]
MTNAQLFIFNYTSAGDVISIIISIVLCALLRVSYIKREENFLVLKKIPVLIIIAAVINISKYWLAGFSGPLVDPGVRALDLIYHICLTAALYYYMDYIRITMQTEDVRWVRLSGIIRVLSGLAVIIQVAAIVFLDAGLVDYVFVAIYTIYMIVFIYMIYLCRDHVYMRILLGGSIAAMLSFALMYAQLFEGHTSYTTATFLFPLIALIYMMHSNPYDFTLGTVGSAAFEDMVAYSFMKGHGIYLVSIFIREINNGERIMPKSLQTGLRIYGERFFKGGQLFKITDGHFILCFDPLKNPSHFEKITSAHSTFVKEYEKFNLAYKVICMDSISEISSKSEYLPFLQFIRERMEANSMLYISEDDIAGYRRHEYILDELRDINLKKDISDPRVLAFCQPVYNTQTGLYDTAEALMRLKLEKTGLVFPDQFIPMAEKHGLIHTLSLIILAKTCEAVKRMLEAGYRVKRVSVNFSMIDVREPDFAKNVKKIIKDCGVPFENIAIELTESQNERDFELIKDRINELKDTGIKFYLDDFGTGYSSFERIMELPFDIIKFDRSLTIASGQDVKLETMVSYLAHMFSDLRYSVLYEGIEDENDEARCMNMCARYLQGYKYSKPVPFEKLTEFFSKE